MGEGYTVIGDTVNVAARLQAAARPGSVTVGETTHRATREAIAYDELEPLELKGKAEPVPAWEAREVLAERRTQRAAPRTGGAADRPRATSCGCCSRWPSSSTARAGRTWSP